MKLGLIKQLREACIQESGGDIKKANKLITEKFEKELNEGKIKAKNISFQALFEGLVNLNDVDRSNPLQVREAVASSAFPNITTLIMHSITIEPYDIYVNTVMNLVMESDAIMTEEEPVPGMTAIGGVRRRIETESYDETDFDEKRVSIRKSDFGRIIALTMEDLFNDRTGMIQAKASAIGEDGGQHQEQMIIESLEVLPRTAFGEATSRAFVYNGTAFVQSSFYSSDHSAIAGLDGQVNDNAATGGITEAGFREGYALFAKMKDEKGKTIKIIPKQVVVHSQYELTLATLLGTELIVGSGNNDINQFGPKGKVKILPVVSPFLATTASLAYMGDFPKSLLWLWVQRPSTITMAGTDDDAFRRQIVWKARFNYYGGVGHRDYRYCVRITA